MNQLAPAISASAAVAPDGGGGLAGWATDVMAALGAPGAGVIVALENLFPPIPSEIILPLAGFAAGRGEFSLLSAIVWTTVGSLVGAVALYVIGMVASDSWVRRTAARMPLVTVEDVMKAEAWFDKHGRASVFWGRMIPGVRSFVSIPAGQRRMPWWEFGLFTTLGSLIWNTVFVVGGYALGSQWQRVEQYAGVFQYIVIVALGALVLTMVIKRIRFHRSRKRMEAPTQAFPLPGHEPRPGPQQ